MILYIHGFRSTIESHKAKILKKHYKENIIIPDYSIIPQQAIKELEKIIENQNIKGIIASSLGGFYATYLSEKYNLKTVLINPSVKPYLTLKKYIGENEKYNGTPFDWTMEHIEMLSNLKMEKITLENYYIFLQQGDEVLDYRKAEERYRGAKLFIESGGNHRFQNFERFFDDVSLLLLNNN